jgi:hypothetical protein
MRIRFSSGSATVGVFQEKGLIMSNFLFQQEAKIWIHSRSQFATLKRGQNIKYLLYAFTERGAIMAANVINSPLAIQMSVFVARALVQAGDSRSGRGVAFIRIMRTQS